MVVSHETRWPDICFGCFFISLMFIFVLDLRHLLAFIYLSSTYAVDQDSFV
jgi:hypothetical protein